MCSFMYSFLVQQTFIALTVAQGLIRPEKAQWRVEDSAWRSQHLAKDVSGMIKYKNEWPPRSARRSKGLQWGSYLPEQVGLTRHLRVPQGLHVKYRGCSCWRRLRSDYVNRRRFKAWKDISHNLYHHLHLSANICPAWRHEISNSSKMNTRFSVALHQKPSGKVFVGKNWQINDRMIRK